MNLCDFCQFRYKCKVKILPINKEIFVIECSKNKSFITSEPSQNYQSKLYA
jgi:hypothetical protein